MQLALAHDPERGSRDAVNGHVERDATRRLRAGQLDAPEFDVAVLPQKLPRCHRLIGDRCEALIANVGGGVFQPVVGRLDARHILHSARRRRGAG